MKTLFADRPRLKPVVAAVSFTLIFNLLIVWAIYLIGSKRDFDLGASIALGFYIIPAVIATTTAIVFIGYAFELRHRLVTPLVVCLGLFSFFPIDYLIWLNQLTPRLVVIGLATLLVAVCVTVASEAVAGLDRFGLVSLSVGMIVITGVGAASYGVGRLDSTAAAQKRAKAYDDITFPLYYPQDGYGSSDANAVRGQSTMTHTVAVDFGSSAFERFGETPYGGTMPTADCGPAYGEDESLPTTWQCDLVRTTASYALYHKRVIYSNPAAAIPYEDYYFAIFDEKTVVWYGGSDYPIPATTTPLTTVVAFYDSLQHVDLHAPAMVKILGNKQV